MTVPPDPLSGRELAAFVAAVDARTLYAAADALALTQSAVTKRIAALERRVGQPLLERGRSGVRPTAAGRALYPEARAALAALDRARRSVADADATSALQVAASHTVAGYLLPGWLAGFRAERGTLRIAVEVVNSPGVLAAVRGGRAELGFVASPGVRRSAPPNCSTSPGSRARRSRAPGRWPSERSTSAGSCSCPRSRRRAPRG
jgi:DNA-binding transcriptional LysR family regulator